MPVAVSLLRAVNVGGHQPLRMAALRRLYESLGLRDVRTYVQSGNVVFRTEERRRARLSESIQDGIEREFGFRPAVMLRSAAELREAIARNPFSGRADVLPNRLLVAFLAGDAADLACQKIAALRPDPEELRLVRELYIHYPAGMGRSKLSMARVEKALGCAVTGRNWNTVTELCRMAEELEGKAPEPSGGKW